MNMKKMLSLALAGVMALSLMACSAQNGGDSSENTSSPGSSQSSEETQNNETPESVTITSLNANKEAAELEVPYDPQRIAILDMASLDILDALGVGDRVVGTASTSLEYLQDYINDDSVEYRRLSSIKKQRAAPDSEPTLAHLTFGSGPLFFF